VPPVCEEPEPYRGPFVVIEPDSLGYRVSVDPPNASHLPRSYREKHDAWAYARDLWTALRAPLRDLTDHNVAKPNAATARENNRVLSESSPTEKFVGRRR
jgi:hypothetical protein